MSRTIRRKNFPRSDRYLSEHVWLESRHGCRYLCRRRLEPGSRDYHLAYWRLHRDNPAGQWTVPKHYRRTLNRAARKGAENKLRAALATDEQDFLPPRRRRNAGWFWF